MKHKVSQADWDREQQMKTARIMRLKYAEFRLDICEICSGWCVSNLDVPIKAHPLCWHDPAYQKALKAAPDPNQSEFAV